MTSMRQLINIFENTIRLTDLYDEDELNDKKEALHLFINEEDLEKEFTIHQMSPEEALTYENWQDNMTVFNTFKKFATKDQKQLVKYKRDRYDNNRVIVVMHKTVLDGNHHLIAGILNKQPIKYINVAD